MTIDAKLFYMQKYDFVFVTATRIIISSQTIHVSCQPDHDVESLLSVMRKVIMKVAAIPSMP